jgi:hypothetical protein
VRVACRTRVRPPFVENGGLTVIADCRDHPNFASPAREDEREIQRTAAIVADKSRDAPESIDSSSSFSENFANLLRSITG